MPVENELSNKRVLLTCGGGVGDIIMFTPALRRLKEKYSCYIGFLTPRNPELLENLSFVDEVVHVPRKKAFSKIASIPKIYAYDAVIITDWQPVVLMAAMVFGVNIRAGFPRSEKFISRFYNKILTHKWHKQLGYVGDNNARLIAEALDIELDGDMSNCEISRPSMQDRIAVNEYLEKIGIASIQDFVVLSPFTNFYLKNYPVSESKSLVRMIEQKYHLPVIVVGGIGDTEDGDRISRYNLCGKTSIMELAELISRARLMVTADSGPMHIAGAVHTPTIAVFGKEIPERWAPRHNCYPISLHYPCSPCKDEVAIKCSKKVGCLRKITAEMVMDKVEEIFNGKGAVK